MEHAPFAVDLTTVSAAALPCIEPAACFTVDPHWAGAWTVAGDLDGDGVAELVQARIWDQNDTHAVVAVSAYRLDGTVLWRWGDLDDGVAALHSDVPCQVHDWDRDGRQEVVVATRTHVIALDGATGRERWRFPTPDPDAADCLTFARLGGRERDDLLLKTRYHRIWAFTWDGRPLWSVSDPGGQKTAHQVVPLDLDGDGRDELLAGYALLAPDGQTRWTLDMPALGLGRGHLDCARVLRRAAAPSDWRLLFTCCADHALLCLDGNGALVWERRGLHFESIDVGQFRPERAEPDLLVDIDHAAPGRCPLHVYDAAGTLLGEINSAYGRHHPLLRWGADAVQRIVACEDRMLLSGATGRPLARFATPLPAGVAFEQAERSPEHTARGRYQLLAHTGSLFGTGRQDLLLATNPGGVLWLYRNPGGGPMVPSGLPPGTGRNVTLY